MFTLAISCLTTSNLPWFMDLTFQVPMQYCSLQHLTLLLSQKHTHSWVLFLLWLHPFVLSGVISPLSSSSISGTYQPGEFPFQYPIILPFHTVHGVLKARILKWFATPFSSGPHSVRPHEQVEVMEFQLSYFKSWKMMLWKCCTQYASKLGKLSSGHRTGKGQFSFRSQRKAMPKNAQTTTQLHSSHTLVK